VDERVKTYKKVGLQCLPELGVEEQKFKFIFINSRQFCLVVVLTDPSKGWGQVELHEDSTVGPRSQGLDQRSKMKVVPKMACRSRLRCGTIKVLSWLLTHVIR